MSDIKLTRPDGTDRLGFLQRVARAYHAAVKQDRDRPAKLIAEAAGVPVTTVHRWILEARRAGALEPARCPTCGQYTYPRTRRRRQS